MDQRAALRRFVSEILSDVGDKTPLTDTDSLLVSGRIDSIEIVRVIQFIEESVFGLINQIVGAEPDPLKQLRLIVLMLLGFAERNPGMTRVLIGDALVTEDGRLQHRINQLNDRIEASVKQCFRNAIEQGRLPPENDPAARANLVVSFVLGRWLRFAKTGFKRAPAEGLERQVLLLIT